MYSSPGVVPPPLQLPLMIRPHQSLVEPLAAMDPTAATMSFLSLGMGSLWGGGGGGSLGMGSLLWGGERGRTFVLGLRGLRVSG